MPFIPHTADDIEAMLQTIGVGTINDLFDEIPADLRCGNLGAVPETATEADLVRLLGERAQQDQGALCFIGAGAYTHHIPAAVWEITTRGEFYSAYTPYQAEASQGTLQLLYEFQSMMAHLTGMEASNASLYDGATALAEAILMAVRLNRKSKSKRVLVPRTLHPVYRKVVHTIVKNQNIELVEIAFSSNGQTDLSALASHADTDIAAVVISQPNFFGVLEDVDAMTNWAHNNKAMAIGVVNPIALGMLKPPGDWGDNGADIACGEGQPLGIPLASGGPYLGFMCCKKSHVRQMPGRIAGRTIDLEGKPGYTLTLQAREQHIRRSKATSNICTNQGLMVTAATIYMSLLGAEGLERIALNAHANTNTLVSQLTAIEGVEAVFDTPRFHEAVIRLPLPAKNVLQSLAASNILGGYDLSADYPELGDAMLVCATEVHNDDDFNRFSEKMARIVTMQGPPCKLRPESL